MSESEFYSDEDHFNDTIVKTPKSVTPSRSFEFQTQQEALDYYKSSPTPSQNTRSSHRELFQSRLNSSTKMTNKPPPAVNLDIPKPLENPILENPLETLFAPNPTLEEFDTEIREPFKIQPTSTQLEIDAVRDVHRINRLKKDRSNIYSSITKMTKSIINVMNGKSNRDWKDLERRALQASENLWKITTDLHDAAINISDEEDDKMTKYSNLLDSHIAKIKAHVRSQITGIPNFILATEKAFKPDPDPTTDEDENDMNGYFDRAAAAPAADQTMVMQEMYKSLIKLNKKTDTPAKKPDSDYRSLKPVEIPTFGGDTMKYHYFKEAFKAAHDWRNLSNTMLALQLQSYLKGPALKLCEDNLKNKIDETSYNTIWEALENRYGGSFNEDAYITEQFDKLPVLHQLSFKDLERTYDMFKIQSDYYTRTDRAALNNTRSLLNKQAKSKLTVDLGYKYITWTEEKRLPKNFASMLEWLKVNYKTAQESNREYSHSAEEKSTNKARDRFHHTRNQSSDESENENEQSQNERDPDKDDQTITFNPRDKSFWVQPKSGGKPYPWNGKTSFPRNPQRFDPTKTVRFENQTTREPLQLKPTDTCILCKVRHEMSECPKFKVLSLKEKKLIVRSSVLCFHCLSTKHFNRDCTVNKNRLCGTNNCKFYHHPLLHADKVRINVEYTLLEMDPLTEEETDSISHLFCETNAINHIAQKGAISLQTVVCNVTSGNKYIKTVALLDTGSTMTAIDEDFALNNNLNIIGKREGQEVYVIDRLVKMKGFQYKIELTVSSVENDTSTRIEAWTIKNLVQNCGIVDWSERKADFPHLKKINFPKLPENPRITILFGCNVTKMFKATTTIADKTNQSGPVAIRTFLGWTCVGNSANPNKLRKDPTSELINVFLNAGEEN